MATDSRLARAVREEVAEILRREISDPRLQFVTITEADVTNDQAYATVYFSAMPQEVLSGDPGREGGIPADDEVAAAFESAAGRIQGLLAKRLTSRRTPELRFEPDPVEEQAARVEALIREVRDNERRGDTS